MIGLTDLIVTLFAIAMAIPVIFVSFQLAAALLPARPTAQGSRAMPRTAVVMPAHNEEASLARSASSILSQLAADGRLVVVADNCTDDTAGVAKRLGADVAVRNEADRIGKGYALNQGVRSIALDPPDVVVFMDADCVMADGSLEILAKRCAAVGRPIQARYAMMGSSKAHPADKLSQLAWTIKTLARPLGSDRLGLPCQLMGSGMAFPYELLRLIDLGTGHLAEDQKLGAELALAGKAPCFCPQAQVISQFPQGGQGRRQQSTRWEHGHFAVIAEFFAPLMARAVATRSLHLLAFALDLCIPPLSLLVLLQLFVETVALAWCAATGSVAPLAISSVSLACLFLAIGAAWRRYGQGVVALGELTAMPAYCLLKLASLLRFFVKRQIVWVRTQR